MKRFNARLFGRLVPVVGAVMLAATFLTMGASAAAPPGPYANGFESAGDAVIAAVPPVGPTQVMFNVTRVPTGTNGITSASGSYHAVAPVGSDAVFTRYGGYSSSFPAGGYTASADIYLNTAAPTSFDWSSAISNKSGGHLRDFVFNVGTDSNGGLVMSASNNAPGWPANPDRHPYAIDESGWYTFQHHFYENGSHELAVDMTVSKLGEATPLASWTLSDPSDTIGASGTVGGNRYGWLINNTQPIALDNITRSGVCTPIPGFNGLTAAQIGGDVTGTFDASGCDIGVYYASGKTGSVNAADISGAKYYGVVVDGVLANVKGSKIHQIGDKPLSGNQYGRAVFYTNGATGTVSDNDIYEYQKNGVVATGNGTNVQVLNNTVTGGGHTATIAQNGVVILSGATALVKGNSISHNWYTGATWTAYGLLIIDAKGVKQQSNSFLDNQMNLGNFGRGGGNTNA